MKTKKFDKCEIQFAGNRIVFYPGEEIQGDFHLHLNKSMDMDKIEITCIGKVKTKWEKSYTNEEGNLYKVEYEGKKKLFEIKQKVYGNGSRETLDAGEHLYPFHVKLPDSIPSSFESKHGHIRYYFKMKVNKPWKKDLKMKKMFVVNELIDSNQGVYRGGPGHNDEKTLGCLCCASGPLTLSANLDRAGYCPGECILATANVGNNTSRDMDQLNFELIQKVEYYAESDHGKHKRDTETTQNTVAILKSEKIDAGKSLDWKNHPWRVPPLPPTSTQNKFIKIKYFVKVWLDVPMGFDLEFNLPITIATVPYLPAYGQPDEVSLPDNVKPAKVGGPPVTFLGHPEMIPHMYVALPSGKPVKLNKDDDKEFQDDKYLPIYPYAMPGKGAKDEQGVQEKVESEDAKPQKVKGKSDEKKIKVGSSDNIKFKVDGSTVDLDVDLPNPVNLNVDGDVEFQVDHSIELNKMAEHEKRVIEDIESRAATPQEGAIDMPPVE